MLTVDSLKIPRSWEIIAGADTGTYLGGLIAAIDPNFELYALEEFPNYRYTGDGTIEEIGITVGEWIKKFAKRLQYWTKKRKTFAWVDANTTFKSEITHGFRFKMNKKDLELRTEITREYLRNGRIHLMPWLDILPYEMEEASFPEQETPGGRFRRIKRKDHILDGLEHICSRRPHPKYEESQARRKSGWEQLRERHQQPEGLIITDVHMGTN
jgi:hypothetical protein